MFFSVNVIFPQNSTSENSDISGQLQRIFGKNFGVSLYEQDIKWQNAGLTCILFQPRSIEYFFGKFCHTSKKSP